VLALAGIVTSTSLGAILCLKATRKGHLILPATTAAVGVSIVTAVLLIPPYGVMGAAVATLIPSSFRTAGLLVSHWAWSRKSAERMYRELQEESASLPARGAVAPQPLSPAEPASAGSLER